jgi:hypothetical protein
MKLYFFLEYGVFSEWHWKGWCNTVSFKWCSTSEHKSLRFVAIRSSKYETYSSHNTSNFCRLKFVMFISAALVFRSWLPAEFVSGKFPLQHIPAMYYRAKCRIMAHLECDMLLPRPPLTQDRYFPLCEIIPRQKLVQSWRFKAAAVYRRAFCLLRSTSGVHL